MHFVPILSTLRRHKIAATLIVLQIALTCAIVCNAIFLIGERLSLIDQPSGVVDDELVRIGIIASGKDEDAMAVTEKDLAALRAIPGVKYAATVDMLPFGGSSWNSSASTHPNDSHPPVNAAIYMGTEDLLETFGVNLVAGRDFNPNEYTDFMDLIDQKAYPPSIIITRGTARALFGDENPLGKGIYIWGDQPQTVVGVVDHIARPSDGNGSQYADDSVFYPVKVSYYNASNYVMRVDPSRTHELLDAGVAALDKVKPNRIIIGKNTFNEIRADYFKADRAMAWLLIGVCIALLVITALGIVGLASFWVQQRTRQIGIRRALGATRAQILSYFQTENFILATLGIVLGMGLAYGINLWLMDTYHVARLPATFLPIGAILLWILGQIAVLGPALRAAAVPPAVATRTV
ncbi:MAG TPA: ABC transporter permease [Kofleriaceae bacterium]|jgi:putative ABC transport system permease protein|nr:ABC transporter permease [Kofleriaceae bacterium]